MNITEIVNEYNAGASLNQLAKKLNLDSRTVKKILVRNNINIRSHQRYVTSDPLALQQNIIDLYKSGYTIPQIIKKLHTSGRMIAKILKNNNVPRTKRYLKKFNRHFFSPLAINQNHEIKSYWVGFIMGDGCLGASNNSLVIQLSRRDINHLYKFKESVEAENVNVKECIVNGLGGERESCVIQLCSREIHQDLGYWGVTPRKSFTAQFKNINQLDKVALFRGLHDSDGWVGESGGYPTVGCCGSKDCMDSVLEFYKEICPSLSASVLPKKNIWSVYTSGNYAIEIIKAMYFDANIYLDRKRQRAFEIIARWSNREMGNQRVKYHIISDKDREDIWRLYTEDKLNYTQIARIIGCTSVTVSQTLKKMCQLISY